MSPSWRCAAAVGAVLLASAAGAAEPVLTLDVVGAVDRDTGAYTHVVRGSWDGVIDFGRVRYDRGPSNGASVETPRGRHLVGTFVVEVRSSTSPRHTTASDEARARRTATPRHGPSDVRRRAGPGTRTPLAPSRRELPPDAWRIELVDVYASISEVLAGEAEVHLAVGDDADWSLGPDVGIRLEAHEVLVAAGVPAGTGVRCQVSLFFPHTARGRQEVGLHLTARPTGGFAAPPARGSRPSR